MNPVYIAANIAAAIIAGAAVLASVLYLPWRMRSAYRQTFIALARAVESREPYLVGHSERVARYVGMMARWCFLPAPLGRRLEYAALLHGIGKVSVPYGLLNNPDTLSGPGTSITATDRFVLRDYVRVGASIIEALPLLRPSAEIVRYHREYYDGSGYPFGRFGAGIPFCAQMLCVASEYAAMTAPRLYRTGKVMTEKEAADYLRHNAGVLYHPAVVHLFLLAKAGEDCWQQCRALAQRIFSHKPAESVSGRAY
jgi:HD-GYP domain-containing protein (c-di-GMP phosphodiesterase class II)